MIKNKKPLKVVLLFLVLFNLLSIPATVYAGGIVRPQNPLEQYIDAVAEEISDCYDATTSWTDDLPWPLSPLAGYAVKPTMGLVCAQYGMAYATVRLILWEIPKFLFKVILGRILMAIKKAVTHFIFRILEYIATEALIIETTGSPNALGDSAVFNDILLTIYMILWPFYMIQIVYVAGYLMFAAIDPGQRAGAKVRLNNLILSLVLCGLAKPLFLLMVDVANGMITEFYSFTETMVSCGGIDYSAEALLGTLVGTVLLIGLSLWLLTVISIFAFGIIILLYIRYAIIVLFYVLFPAIIFLYFFDYTRQLGGDMLARSIMWVFMGPVMALMISLTMLLMVGNVLDVQCTGGALTVQQLNPSLHADLTNPPEPSQGIEMPSGGEPGDLTTLDDTQVEFGKGYAEFTEQWSDDETAVQRFMAQFIGVIMIMACFFGIFLIPFMMTSLMKWVGGAIAASGMAGLVQSRTKVERWRNFGKIAVGGALMGQGTRGIVTAATQASWMQPSAPVAGGGLLPSMSETKSFLGRHTPPSLRSGRFGAMINKVIPPRESVPGGGAAGGVAGAGEGGGAAPRSAKIPILGDLAGVFLADRKNMAETTKYWAAMEGGPTTASGGRPAGAGPPGAGAGRAGAGGRRAGVGRGRAGAAAEAGVKHVDEVDTGTEPPRSIDTRQMLHAPPSPGRSKEFTVEPGYQDQAVEMTTEQAMKARKGFDETYAHILPSGQVFSRTTHGIEGAMTLGRGLVRLFTPGAGASVRRAAVADFKEGGKHILYSIRPLSFLLPIRAMGRVIFGVTPEFLPPVFQPYGYWLGRHMASLSLRQVGRRSVWKSHLLNYRGQYENLNEQMRNAETAEERERLRGERDRVGDSIVGLMDKIGYGYESRVFAGEEVRDWNFYRRQMGIIRDYNPELYSHIMAKSSEPVTALNLSDLNKTYAKPDAKAGETINKTVDRLADRPDVLGWVNEQRGGRGEAAFSNEDEILDYINAQRRREGLAELTDRREAVKELLRQEMNWALNDGSISQRKHWLNEIAKTSFMDKTGVESAGDQKHFEKVFGSGFMSSFDATAKSHLVYSSKGPLVLDGTNLDKYFDDKGIIKHEEGHEFYLRDRVTNKKYMVVGASRTRDGRITLTLNGFKQQRYFELKDSYLTTAGNNEYTFHSELYQDLRQGGYSHEKAFDECRSKNIHMHVDRAGRRYVDAYRLQYIAGLRARESVVAHDGALGSGRVMDEEGVGLQKEDEEWTQIVGKLRRAEKLTAAQEKMLAEREGEAARELGVGVGELKRMRLENVGRYLSKVSSFSLSRTLADKSHKLYDVNGSEIGEVKKNNLDNFMEAGKVKKGIYARDTETGELRQVKSLSSEDDKVILAYANKIRYVGSETGRMADVMQGDFEHDLVRDNGGRITGTAIHKITEAEQPKSGRAMTYNGEYVEPVGGAAHIIEGDKAIIVQTEFDSTENSHKIYDARENVIGVVGMDNLREYQGMLGARKIFYTLGEDGHLHQVRGLTKTGDKITLTHQQYYHLGQWSGARGAFLDENGHPHEIMVSTDLVNRESIQGGDYKTERMQFTAYERDTRIQEIQADLAGRKYEERLMTARGTQPDWSDLDAGTQARLIQAEQQAARERFEKIQTLHQKLHVRPGEVEGLRTEGYTALEINEALLTAWETHEAFNDSQWRRVIRDHIDPGKTRHGEDAFERGVEQRLVEYKEGGLRDNALRDKLDKEGVRLNSVELYDNAGDPSPARVEVEGVGAHLKVNMGYYRRESVGSKTRFNKYLRNDYLNHEFRHSWARRRLPEIRDQLMETHAGMLRELEGKYGEASVQSNIEEFVADLRSPEDDYGEDVDTQLDAREIVRRDVLNAHTATGVQSRQELLNLARFSVEEETGLRRMQDNVPGYEEYKTRLARNNSFSPDVEEGRTSFDQVVEASVGRYSPRYMQYQHFKSVLRGVSQIIEQEAI